MGVDDFGRFDFDFDFWHHKSFGVIWFLKGELEKGTK